MEIEEIISLLSEVKGKELTLRRSLKEASTMAKGFKYYIIEMWLPDTPAPVCSVKMLGQYTLEHRDEIKHSAEMEFMRNLFMRM